MAAVGYWATASAIVCAGAGAVFGTGGFLTAVFFTVAFLTGAIFLTAAFAGAAFFTATFFTEAFFAAAFAASARTLAHRFFVASMIAFRPATESLRLGLAGALAGAGSDSPRIFAHLRCCAAFILRFVAAENFLRFRGADSGVAAALAGPPGSMARTWAI